GFAVESHACGLKRKPECNPRGCYRRAEVDFDQAVRRIVQRAEYGPRAGPGEERRIVEVGTEFCGDSTRKLDSDQRPFLTVGDIRKLTVCVNDHTHRVPEILGDRRDLFSVDVDAEQTTRIAADGVEEAFAPLVFQVELLRSSCELDDDLGLPVGPEPE